MIFLTQSSLETTPQQEASTYSGSLVAKVTTVKSKKVFSKHTCYLSAGNLTKHMKSKAHMKKCLELGVSVTMDEAEIQEQGKMLTYSIFSTRFLHFT